VKLEKALKSNAVIMEQRLLFQMWFTYKQDSTPIFSSDHFTQ